jgi:large subunit ribosomal protein L17
MRKKVFGRKLARSRKSREALFRGLISALVLNGQIVTTKAKAKAIQGDVDKLTTILKKDTIVGYRLVSSKLGNNFEVVSKWQKQIIPATKERKSGFTRIVNLAPRKGDLAKIVRLEFVDKPEPVVADKKGKTKTSKQLTAAASK